MAKRLVYAIIGKGRAIMKVAYKKLTCKFCGSRHIASFEKFSVI